jgi:diguanylate cyclase (GGDEF)-like protein
MHDPITGLYDRGQFFKILDKQIGISNDRKISTALLVIEVQRFRRINANYGYAAGDEVLRGMGDLLKQVQRSGDYSARIGNDCFALVLTRIVNPGHAQLAAFKIHRLLEVPFEVNGEKIRCDAVVGIALCPTHSSGTDGLLKAAEDALAHARGREQNLGMLAVQEEEGISDDWDIEYELSGAIERCELSVFFQPKVSIAGGQMVPTGAEALVRWNSRARGLVPPDVFLPIAERMGLMKALTVWMLNSALRLSRTWTNKWGDLGVSVNIPPTVLAHPDFVDLVFSTLNLWHSDHIFLCLEILEQSFEDDVATTFRKLRELRAQGVRISIDDFGTGYSSLSHFRDIPTDELKVDKSFVFDLPHDQANLNIVGLVIDLAHRFGLSVVAEGVEDQALLSVLRDMECDQVQGYGIAKPMPARDFSSWLLKFYPS